MRASNKKSPDRQGIQGKVFLDIVDDVFFSVLAHEKYNKSIEAGTSCHKTIYVSKFDGRKVRIECLHIVGKGVCGTAVAEDATQLVPDVHEFPGHIACDSASNSEIVIPIHVGGEIWGVLDIDSPYLNRCTEEDKAGLERFVKVLEKIL